jgi:hypothetical protein
MHGADIPHPDLRERPARSYRDIHPCPKKDPRPDQSGKENITVSLPPDVPDLKDRKKL